MNCHPVALATSHDCGEIGEVGVWEPCSPLARHVLQPCGGRLLHVEMLAIQQITERESEYVYNKGAISVTRYSMRSRHRPQSKQRQ